ncbi:MAG: hypothetical protein K9H16_09835 [Bacteroidales bacterium]|nr:hypothetical protein [Bacteroidales bacterium]
MEISEIQETLRNLILEHVPPLQVRQDNANGLEVAGTKEAMQGKQKVSSFYFGSIVPKPKDVRLYFFPIYTHALAFQLSPELKKMLKGKSCFHITKLDEALIFEIKEMIEKGLHLYEEEGLV